MDKGISDEDLMLSYRDGNQVAFETLYSRHKGGIYRFLLSKCKNNKNLAEELHQDVWMKLIAAKDRYEVKAKFTTYLYQLACNRFIDYYRREKTSGQYFQSFDNCDTESIQEQSRKQPEIQAELQQQVEYLADLLDKLPVEQRDAFILKEESGLSIHEIAEVMSINPETAKSRLRYAVNKLQAGLKAYE